MTKNEMFIKMDEMEVPRHMQQSLVDYLSEGTPVGHFLQAVLENNLKEAIARGDEINQRALPNYVKFLYNYAPQVAWGHKGVMEEYRDYLRRNREETQPK